MKLKDVHTISTRNVNADNLHIPYSNTTRYGLNSIYRKSIDTLNYFTKQTKVNLRRVSRNKLKKLIAEQFFVSYRD